MGKMDYPPGILKKLQETELKLLQVVTKLCRDHNLVYFIDGGTCLGAVRHGGFIPWDDDIDIGMPMEDYLKFLKLAPKHLPSGYSLHSCENTENFTALWAKVYIDGTHFEDSNCIEAGTYQGIFLDVFPYFQLDENPHKARHQRRILAFWQALSYLKGFAHPNVPPQLRCQSILKKLLNIVHILLKIVPQKLIVSGFWRAASPSVASDIWYCGAPISAQTIFDGQTLFPTQDILFAGFRVQAPADLDTYLRSMYGDYMQIPPREQRHTHVPEVLDFGDGVNVMK